MSMKLILFPLAFIFCLAVLAQLGAGGTIEPNAHALSFTQTNFTATDTGYWDTSGHQLSTLGAWGLEKPVGEWGLVWGYGDRDYWLNVTNAPYVGAYDDPDYNSSGVDTRSRSTTYPCKWLRENDTSGIAATQTSPGGIFSFGATDLTYGWLAVVAVLMVIAAVAGLSVFGIGITDFSVSALVKGGAFMSIWVALSVLGAGAFNAVPTFGFILYMVLTLAYAVGVINQFGHPGG